MGLKPPLPGETASAYHRRVIDCAPELPVVSHELSEGTKVALSLGRTVAVVAAIFGAGWIASTKVGEVLTRQDRTDQKLAEMLTKSDLMEMQNHVEMNLRKRLASSEVIVNCPIFSARGQTHKRCPIVGLTEPRGEDMER